MDPYGRRIGPPVEPTTAAWKALVITSALFAVPLTGCGLHDAMTQSQILWIGIFSYLYILWNICFSMAQNNNPNLYPRKTVLSFCLNGMGAVAAGVIFKCTLVQLFTWLFTVYSLAFPVSYGLCYLFIDHFIGDY